MGSDGDAEVVVIEEEFEPVTENVSRARQLVDRLPRAAAKFDDVRLIVSELASNAIRHARTRFRVALRHFGDVVRVEVTDRSDGQPVVCQPESTDPHGRGLFIVAALARRWGVEPEPGGKTIWAEVTLPAAVH